MADDERDPSEPVEQMPPLAIGPNVTGDDDMAINAHRREELPAKAKRSRSRPARSKKNKEG
jgi:hypothetical protein